MYESCLCTFKLPLGLSFYVKINGSFFVSTVPRLLACPSENSPLVNMIIQE